MPFEFFFDRIQFSDGTQIPLSQGELAVIIGPNNAGKSEALRDLHALLNSPVTAPPANKVIRSASVRVSRDQQSIDEFIAGLERNPGNNNEVGRMGSFGNLPWLRDNWNSDDYRRHIHSFTVRLLHALERISLTSPASAIDFRRQPMGSPIHYVYRSERLELELSADFRRAFGTDLVTDHTAGSVMPLLVGDRPVVAPPADRLSDTYRDALLQLPRLENQGDGMRSFVGTLLWARIADFRVLLLDEPEAFLHPPQARLLGRTLVTTKKPSTQIIAASHSGDFLRGALDARAANLRVIRIVRDGSVNRARELDANALRELWSDPLIRYSNLLDALFHEQCVVCESEGDCQFYAAILQTILDRNTNRRAPQVMFTSVGGKAKFPKAVRALANLNIAVRVIADFDILRDEQPLKGTFDALGGSWTAVESDWKTVSRAISSRKAELDAKDTRTRINAVLDCVSTAYVPDTTLRDIRDITRKASAWSEAKTIGEPYIPAGEATAAYARLKAELESKGLFVVPVGELEGFDKTITASRHGPAWLGEVMQKDLTQAPFDIPRAFVEKVLHL
jgi:hypothetical protein